MLLIVVESPNSELYILPDFLCARQRVWAFGVTPVMPEYNIRRS